MRIIDITSVDTGGQSYKLARAIREYTEHESHSFIKELDYLNFPYENILGKHDRDFAKEYFASADIVHLHNKYRNANGWYEYNKNAKWLIHQHGRFGDNTDLNEIYDTDKKRGALRVVSTLNLLPYVNNDPERWIPAPFRLSDFTALKEKYYRIPTVRHPRKFRIAHSPTNRTYKNTDLLIRICSKIPNAELVLIEKKTNAEALLMRATCDITYDQMHLCYGNSGLEGMAFGQPVICGMPDRVRGAIKNYIGYEPFLFATPQTLMEKILLLMNDKDIFKHYSEISTKYINDWHCDKKVAERVVKIYNNL